MVDILVQIMADWLVIPVVLIGAMSMLYVPRARRYEAFARGLMTGLVALLLAKIGSYFYEGERPFVELGEEPKAAYLNNPGFPSDHTLLVFVITLVVWASTKNIKLGSALAVLSVLVALGRVIALVHTPVDVIGGIVFACLAALLIYGRKLFDTKTKS